MELSVRQYRRKLYSMLQALQQENERPSLCEQLSCWGEDGLEAISRWHRENGGTIAEEIAASSDRVNLTTTVNSTENTVSIRHPISGEVGTVNPLPPLLDIESIPECIRERIRSETDPQKVFWWFWRFYPELWLNPQSTIPSDGLLYPAHRVLPDCPLHSYQATVSALTGAMFPEEGQEGKDSNRPYLLIFTFSPIQDFIKASRKFLDFWAGSYLLHYLSARLCWHIAQRYGPDAVIVPSLWGQDIIDAFLLEHYTNDAPGFTQLLENSFRGINDKKTPVERFNDRSSTSLSTAGFPNVITALIPGQENAKQLGEDLSKLLCEEWLEIGRKIRDDIREKVSEESSTILSDEEKWSEFWQEICEGLPSTESEAPYRSDLEKWRSQRDQYGNSTYPNWEWNELWEQQLKNAWEPYWATVPLGSPQHPLSISQQNETFEDWKTAQSTLSKAWLTIPSPAEECSFTRFNVGTWWGSFQQRLRIAIQTVKNTRSWTIPVAPGERSTISGQYSAVHPNLSYRRVNRHNTEQDFREGAGVPEGSMRLFWLLMSKAYPGLFNGSERLNALELTKRMAWIYGDTADSLGIPVKKTIKRVTRHRHLLDRVQINHVERFLYDRFIRFPSISSIAAARFVHDNPDAAQRYYQDLEKAIEATFGQKYKKILQRIIRRRPSHIPKTDRHIRPTQENHQYLNGVMFSAKWLAEDLGLDRSQTEVLKGLVDRQNDRFKEGSPSDWWAVVLADGDGMGQYISGTKLEKYGEYINKAAVQSPIPGLKELYDELYAEQKRMGPATHVGLNRALLDFSNGLVPYLTEKRFCGKVIYSGGDDVMAVLPLEDLPGYLRSLRAAWSGKEDPEGEFEHGDGYWRLKPEKALEGIPNRPLFTMGKSATMSMGVVIAHKSVPLPTVLENLWVAESDRAKEMADKDGICFRVIYGSGNTLEALMKGHLLDQWWGIAQQFKDQDGKYQDNLSPMLYRLAEELPKRVDVSHPELFSIAAQVIMHRRDENRKIENIENQITPWLNAWATWANETVGSNDGSSTLGATSEDLGHLLRFTAFWIDKMVQREKWKQPLHTNPDRLELSTTVGE